MQASSGSREGSWGATNRKPDNHRFPRGLIFSERGRLKAGWPPVMPCLSDGGLVAGGLGDEVGYLGDAQGCAGCVCGVTWFLELSGGTEVWGDSPPLDIG